LRRLAFFYCGLQSGAVRICDLQFRNGSHRAKRKAAKFRSAILVGIFYASQPRMTGLISCRTCGLVQQLEHLPQGHKAECARCGEVLLRDRIYSRPLTAALALAALFLYVPANIYPVMVMHYLGRETENTVWGGIQALWVAGMWGVAIIVFLASMLVPLLKLVGLFYLVLAQGRSRQRFRTRVFKIIEKIGPWAMLDVFLLAIMVAVVRFGKFATVIPGPGIIAFTAVVVLTLLAVASFEPRLIWKEENGEHYVPRPE
jgi:paraquat-inducible protein A